MLIFIFTTLTFMYLGFILCFMGFPGPLPSHTHKTPPRAPGVWLCYKHTRSLQLANFNACSNYCLHFALVPGVMEWGSAQTQEIHILRGFPGGITASHPVIYCVGRLSLSPALGTPLLMEKSPRECSAVHSSAVSAGKCLQFDSCNSTRGKKIKENSRHEEEDVSIHPQVFSMCCLIQESAGEHWELIPLQKDLSWDGPAPPGCQDVGMFHISMWTLQGAGHLLQQPIPQAFPSGSLG